MFIKKKPNPAESPGNPFGPGANRLAKEDVTDIEARIIDVGPSEISAESSVTENKKAQAVHIAPEKRGLFSKFAKPGLKKQSDKPKKASATKSLFAGLRGGTERAEKPTKKPLSSFSRGRREEYADVFVELESGKRVYWRITPDSVTQVHADEVQKALSFSRNDYRYVGEKGLSYKSAEDLALSELGEPVRLINASKTHKAIYVSLETRVEELKPVAIGSGLYLVDAFVQKRGLERTRPHLLVVVLLQSATEAGQSLGVFLHFNESGDMSPIQIAVNPENLELLLTQFSGARRFALENADVVTLGNKDFIALAADAPVYPQERLWNGLSLKKTVWAAAVVGVLCAGAGAAFAGYGYIARQQAQDEEKRLSAQVQQIRSDIDELARTSLKSFAMRFSVNVGRLTETAGKLWQPGTKINVEATPPQETYNIVLPLTIDKTIGKRPIVAEQILQYQVDAVNKAEIPENCNKSIPKLSGGLNVYQITVTCENSDTGIRGVDIN